jgi:hypothetical protein
MSPEAVSFDEGNLTVSLSDGRKISVPLAWFPRLLHATPDQLAQVELSRHVCIGRRWMKTCLLQVCWQVHRA